MRTRRGSCLKFLVFFFNAAFLILGVLLTLLSGLVYSGSLHFATLIDESLATPAFCLMMIGMIVVLVSFVGTLGSLTENYCLLMTFASVVAVSFLTEIISLTFIAYYDTQVESLSVKAFQSYIDQYYTSNSSREFVDNIQTRLGCCGSFGPQDFLIPSNQTDTECKTSSDPSYPSSCCFDSLSLCLHPYNETCPQAIAHYFTDNMTVLYGVSVLLLLVQILPMIFAYLQANNTRVDYYRFV